MKSLKIVKIKGVQGLGVNPTRDILIESVLFEDFTWLGNELRIFVRSNSYPGEFLKQEISAILLRSTLFEDFTWLGIGHWVFVVSYSYPGRSLKQEISAILLFSFIGDAVEVPEREKPSKASRSRCLRSSALGRAGKRKPTKMGWIRTQ